MAEGPEYQLIHRCFDKAYGANPPQTYSEFFRDRTGSACSAVLGYRRASDVPLFLEAYLDRPVEHVLGQVLGRPVERGAIVELGNLAASNAFAMLQLWGSAANDLGGSSEIAVATLTLKLRRMFRRIGVPLTILAPARPEAIGGHASSWGRYYGDDPCVCAGMIAQGQEAIAQFLFPRQPNLAA